MNNGAILSLHLSPYGDNAMQKFEIPLYIWFNATALIVACAFVWGRILGEAAEHKRHVRLHGTFERV